MDDTKLTILLQNGVDTSFKLDEIMLQHIRDLTKISKELREKSGEALRHAATARERATRVSTVIRRAREIHAAPCSTRLSPEKSAP